MSSNQTFTATSTRIGGVAAIVIDIDSPYYLHPSDRPGKPLKTIILTGDNYISWRRAMINALDAKIQNGIT